MRLILLALLALAATPTYAVTAATPEDAYLAARDAYVAEFKRHEPTGDEGVAAHDRALADLEGKLRQIIGPVAIKGLPGDGKSFVNTLFEGDEDFARLDGLFVTNANESLTAVVTTPRLYDIWLRTHEDFWKEAPLPRDLRAALKRDDFYTQALSGGSAVVIYADIPVTAPVGADLAVAVLNTHTQDLIPAAPDEMIITVRRADRLFFITTRAKAGRIAACDKSHAELTKQAEAAAAAFEKSGRKDAKLEEKMTQAEHAVDEAYPSCFATQARSASFFPALVKQAQQLIDALPAAK
jgi:hypothetical protein